MNRKILLPFDIYNKHLKIINGVSFTYREVDVISALLNMEGNRLPSFLSIQPRGIETHTRNIRQKAGGLADQKSIIEFVKQSENFNIIKNEYFLHLQIRVFFEKQLRKLAKTFCTSGFSCRLLYEENSEHQSSLISSLKEHLKLAGITLTNETKDARHRPSLDFSDSNKGSEKGFLIYILSENTREISQQAKQAIKNSKTILLSSRKEEGIQNLLGFKDFIYINNKQLYYQIIFEILKNFGLVSDLDNIISEFNAYCEEVFRRSSNLTPPIYLKGRLSTFLIPKKSLNFLKKWNLKVVAALGALSSLIVLSITFWTLYVNDPIQKTNIEKIQSDLLIPTQITLLNRDKLLTEMKRKLIGQTGIQIVSLVGCGGAGKTTLARQYARQQPIPLIWEVNAETKESLMTSLEALAYAASKTPEEKRELREIQEIKNPSEREGQLLIFLKNRLRTHPHWLLIYDNVEFLTDIQSYFPHDSKIWGNGHVIITTQNINIKKNSYVENMKVINVGELSESEKLYLFNKIINSGEDQITPLYKDNVQKIKFLKEIPPFPLDVSTAAYFLKDTQISYDQYLGHLNAQFDYFDENQYAILRDVGKYNKTRYAIISLSLKQIIDAHQDFKDVLLLISLIDSQNIPKELLSYYQNNHLTEKFLNELKKRSFIIEGSNNKASTFSLHRSVQKTFLSCLIKKYSLTSASTLLHKTINLIDKYVSEKIDQEDIAEITPFVSHLEKLLKHKNIFSLILQDSIKGNLGIINYYLGKHNESVKLLHVFINSLQRSQEDSYKLGQLLAYLASAYIAIGDIQNGIKYHLQSIDIFQKDFPNNYIKIASHLTYLGNAYRDSGEYVKAKDTLEYACNIFNNKSLQNHVSYARNLVDLGKVYRSLGEYKKAKTALEQGFFEYKRHLSKDHFRSAWAAVHLAHLYNDLQMYAKARELLEYALLIYQGNFSPNHMEIAWVLTYLGYTNKGLGQSEKANKFFNQALLIYKKSVPDNHIEVAWALVGLGSLNLKPVIKDANLIKKCLAIYEKYYGETHTEVARILINLAEIYDRQADLKNAEDAFTKASRMFEKTKHPDNYMALEALGEIYYKKFMYEQKHSDLQQAQIFKDQAIDFLNQALKLVTAHFPKDSPHISRIQSKIENLEKG